MGPIFDGSLFLRFCKKISRTFSAAAETSLLLGRKNRPAHSRESRIAAWLNRFHLSSSLENAMRDSRLCRWLYNYPQWISTSKAYHLLLLFAPVLLLTSIAMAAQRQWMHCGILLTLLGFFTVFLSNPIPLTRILSGSRLLQRVTKHLSVSEKPSRPSFSAYLCCCGLCGGIVAIQWGMGTGLALAIAMGIFPVFFALPPMLLLYLLMAVLPVGNTTLCWGMSLALCVLYFFARAFGNEEGKPLDGTDLLLLLFPVFCVLSTLFSFHIVGSAKVAFMWLGLFVCVFVIRRLVHTRRRLIGTVCALLAGAVLSGGYGLYQYLSGMVNTTWTDTSIFQSLDLRVYSTFANPNVFGEFLLLVIPLATGMLLYSQKLSHRILWAAVDTLLLCNLALTYSRGCYVGLALAAVIFLWHFSKKWLVMIIAAAVPLSMLLMPQSIIDRLMSIGNTSDTSTSFRIYIYIGTALMLARHWFGGVGLGEEAFNAIYPYYSLPAIVTPHSHSLFLQAVCSFGIAGLVYTIWVFGHYQRATASARNALAGRDRGLMLGFNTVFWGIILQSGFDYTWYNYRVFQLFWILFSLGLCAAEILKKQEVQTHEKTPL